MRKLHTRNLHPGRVASLSIVAVLAVTGCDPATSDGAGAPDAVGQAEWETAAPVPEPRTEVSVTALGDRIYVLGGFGPPPEGATGASAPRIIWAYDASSDAWEAVGELPEGTHHAALVGLDDRLYLLGGYTETSFSPTGRTLIFDPASQSWSEGEAMPTPRGALAWAVLDGRIHTIGGTVADIDALDHEDHGTDSPDSSVGTHEVYDPATDSWTRLEPMPTARNHHTAGAVDGRIVVSAGRAGPNSTMTVTEVYDPATGTWSTGAAMPTGRSGVASVAHDDWWYVFGGEGFGDGSRTYDDAERYSIIEDRWEVLESMPSARHGLGAAVVDERIHVISGGPQPGFTYGTAHEVYRP